MPIIEEPLSPVSPFGVKLRSANIPRKERAYKAKSMSFLESSSKPNRQLLVQEFKDPFDTTPDRSADSLPTTRNKWSTSVIPREKDSNNNRRKSSQSNRSSCAFSDDAFYAGDELQQISDDAKPILKLWASRSKQNVSKRYSEIGTSSTSPVTRRARERKERPSSSYLEQGLNNTPWGKYFQPANATSRTAVVRPLSCQINSHETIKKETTATVSSDLKDNSSSSQRVDTNEPVSTLNQHKPLIRTSPRLERSKRDNNPDTAQQVKTVRVEPLVRVQSKQLEDVKTVSREGDFNNNTEDLKESKTSHKESSKETSKSKRKESSSVKRLIRIKSLDLRDLRFTRRNSNKDEEVNNPTSPQTKSPDNSRERKQSSKQKQEHKQASSKKKHSKRSKSVKAEYVRVDFLQQPQKINKSCEENTTVSNNTSLENSISLSDKADLIDYTASNHVHKSHEFVNESRRKSIDNSLIDGNTPLIHYDKKERIDRPKSLSLKSCEIDLSDTTDNDKNNTYTNIEDQITGTFKTQSEKLHTRQINGESTTENELNNIAYARRNSEPVVKTPKQRNHVEEKNEQYFSDEETVNVFDSNFENSHSEGIINDHSNDEMNSSYGSRYSSMPGSYYKSNQRTTLDSLIDKSTKNGSFGLGSYISSDKYSSKDINELLSKTKSRYNNGLSDQYNTTEDYRKVRAVSEPERGYTKVKVQEKNITNTTFYPKSAYLRQRLQDLGEINPPKSNVRVTSTSLHNRDKPIPRLQRSATTSDDSYDPKAVDAFIKSYKDRQLNYSTKSASSSGYSSLSDRSSLQSESSTLERLSTVRTSSLHEDLERTRLGRKSRSSSQSSTGSSKVESSVFKKLDRSQSRGSRSSSVSDSEEMDRIFHRNSSARVSGSRFTRNEPKRLSEKSTEKFQRNEPNRLSQNANDKTSTFTRSLSTRSSDRSSRSVSPLPSPTPLVNSGGSGLTTPEGRRSLSPTSPTAKSKSSIFSIKKITSAKIPNAEELKTSAKKKESKKVKDTDVTGLSKHQEESKTDVSPSRTNDSTKHNGEEHEKHGFSFFHKKKHNDGATSPPSPKQQHQRKHSLSNIFSLKKNKEKEATPPNSPKNKHDKRRSSAPVSPPSPVPAHTKERRGSAFMKLFHKKSHAPVNGDVTTTKDSIDNIEETQNENDELLSSITKPINNVDDENTEEISSQNNIIKQEEEKEIEPTIKNTSSSEHETVKKTISTSATVKITTRRTQSEYTPSSSTNVEETTTTKDRSLSVGQTVKTKGVSITVNGQSKQVSEDKEFLVKSGQEDGFVHVDEANNENITKSTEMTETPDIISPSDETNKTTTIQDQRNKRKERRMQGLNQDDLNTALNLPDKTPENNHLNISSSTNGDLGSSESLYDSDCGTKRSSRNKERIRNRKAARKEAQERHKSLPAGLGDVDISQITAQSIDNKENKPQTEGSQTSINSTTTPKTRKKHRARRANTEFIVNVPNINIEGASPQLSRDDGVVMRRNNKRNIRRDRPRTLTAGIDSDLIFGQDKDDDDEVGSQSGVVQENMSFADVKKKLLAGLTDDKKIPEKVPQKERQKIKRTKSTKRYKTITEGIAPRDLELARQAMEAQNDNGDRNTIDKDTLAQITAALTSTSDKRKSIIVESRPGSRYQSQEDLHLSDPELNKKDNKTDAAPRPAPLHRTKSMTTMHLQLDKHEDDEDEPEIKPLSELKNRFLQAMEDTKQKHLTKKSPVEIKRRNKGGRSRQDRPHTICGLDNFTMEQLQNEIGNAPDSELKKQNEVKREIEQQKQIDDEQNRLNELKKTTSLPPTTITKTEEEQPKKREKKKYGGADSQKIFDDLFDDIENILDEGISESDLADAIGCNPSLHQETEPVAIDLQLTGNKSDVIETNEVKTEPNVVVNGGEPLSDLDFVSSQSTQLSSSIASDRRSVKPKRRQRTGAANPVKALQNRDDLIDEDEISKKPKDDMKSAHPVVEAYRGLKQTAENKNQNPVERLLNRDLADEAVSALRATVDFSKTKLRKVEVGQKASDVLADNFVPSEVVNLLIKVKGRKKVQTTVVDFKAESLNSNDCFIIVTPKELVCWHGAQANVIERAKEKGTSQDVDVKNQAAEVASRINQKKEMGCKALDVVYLDQGASDGKVLRLLEATGSKVESANAAVYDEDFEKMMTSAYMTYEVCNAGDEPELVPFDAQCHRMPSKDILLTDTAFVFDFISEVYVWLGRQTTSPQRKVIQELAAKKFEEGYFKLKLESAVSPTHLPQLGNSRRISVTASTSQHRSKDKKSHRRVSIQQGRHQKREMVPRPPHSLLLQLYEGSEWVIFKEKFCDWPDESRIIRMKGGPGSNGEVTKVKNECIYVTFSRKKVLHKTLTLKISGPSLPQEAFIILVPQEKGTSKDVDVKNQEVSTEVAIQAVDPTTMAEPPPMYKMVLENLDIGRGRGIPKGMDGYHIITLDVKTWHVSENNSILMPDASFGQFHSGEGYVIRWQYRVVKVRALRNCDDVMKAGGMERCCYFFWLGNDCSVNEEGATAVMTIELDKEKGPQIRVVLGKEPPALLNLFDGCMVIHAGKRPAPGLRTQFTDQSVMRLYCVRNEEPSESCLLQVPAMCESLRSRGSFLLLLCTNGEVFLWHGCKSNEGTRKTAEHAAQMLIQNHPDEAHIGDKTELGFHEIEEGDEPEVFWIALGGQEDYGSLLDTESDVSTVSPRLFHLDATTDEFVAHEITSPSRTPIFNCPFPILQDDMYNVEQPAIFLVDAITHVWLWFGWWPDEAETEASMSRRRRWGEERRKAMESAVAYADQMGRNLQNMYCVYAGLEPESFIELFPYWVIQEDITDLQLDDICDVPQEKGTSQDVNVKNQEGIEEDKLYKIAEELALFSKEFYSVEELRAKPPPQGVDPTKLEKYLSEEDFLEVFKFHKATFYKLPVWQQTNWKKKVGFY